MSVKTKQNKTGRNCLKLRTLPHFRQGIYFFCSCPGESSYRLMASVCHRMRSPPPPQKKRFFFSVAVFPLSFPGTPTHTCKSSCYITKPHIESQGNSYSICFSCGGAPLFPHLSAHVCFIVPYPPGRTTRGSSIIALSFGTH